MSSRRSGGVLLRPWLVAGASLTVVHPAMGQVAASPSVVAEAEWTSRVIEQYAADIESDVEFDGVGGISAGVAVGRDVVWAAGFGWADRARDIPAGPETVYRIGSISKTVTAALLMRLADSNVVELDDRVVQYLPEFERVGGDPLAVRSITLRQLASHTGGLIREPRLEGAAAGPLNRWASQVVASIPTTSLQHGPGSRYAYSNIGYGILGLTLSRAAGREFMALVREQIFVPLEMWHSEFVVTPALGSLLATGYANRRDGTVDVALPAREHQGRGYKVPNGGVYSTVADLAKFFGGLMGAWRGDFLSSASRHEMLSLQTPGDSIGGYGLGVFVRALDDGGRTIGHSGSVAGYNVYAVFELESQIGVILLRNYNRGRTNLGTVASAWLTDLVAAYRPAR